MGRPISYWDRLRNSNGVNDLKFNFNNPIFCHFDEDEDEDDDTIINPDKEDPNCPTILLFKEEKKKLRTPWKKSLIIEMFDGSLGCMQLMKRLKTKWAIEGDLTLVGKLYHTRGQLF